MEINPFPSKMLYNVSDGWCSTAFLTLESSIQTDPIGLWNENECYHVKWRDSKGGSDPVYTYSKTNPQLLLMDVHYLWYGRLERWGSTELGLPNDVISTGLICCTHGATAGPYKLLGFQWKGEPDLSLIPLIGSHLQTYGFTRSEMIEIESASYSQQTTVLKGILLGSVPDQVADLITNARSITLTYSGNEDANVIQLSDGPKRISAKDFLADAPLGFDRGAMQQRLSELYFQFADSLRIQSNNVANILTVTDLVKGIRKPASLLESTANFLKKGAKGAASDAWLKYRYVYNTTMSDIEAHCKALLELDLTEREAFVLRNSFKEPVDTHVKFIAVEDLSSITDAQALWVKIQQLGLQPDLYNLWDLVPFSFVADWILPIGDKLEALQKYNWLKSMPYNTLMLVSHKGEFWDGNAHYDYYMRYAFYPDDTTIFIDSGNNPSVKTWVKRGIDLIALA